MFVFYEPINEGILNNVIQYSVFMDVLYLPSFMDSRFNKKSENYLISLGCDDCGAELPLEGCSASLPSLPPLFLTAEDLRLGKYHRKRIFG